MPVAGENYDDVILGGCCISDDLPRYGYECPVDQDVYYMGGDGVLIKEKQEE